MGTRAIIEVEGFETAVVYKHWDGYPEGMLDWLNAFNKDFVENRGNDLPYKFAQLLRFSAKNADKFNLDNSDYTGWGVYGKNEIDSQYTYILKQDGSVTVCKS